MTGRDDQYDMLLEQVTSAWRPRDPDGSIRGHPAWFDLDEAGRLAAFEATRQVRLMEAALDPRGLSATGVVVLQRIVARQSPD